MNKANRFPVLTAPFPLILLSSNSFIAFEVILLINPGKLSLMKGMARSVTTFLPNLPIVLPSQEPRNPPD